jgi:hypothetical protein
MALSAHGSRYMSKITRVLAVLFVFAGISAAAAAQSTIGNVVRCEGPCLGAGDGFSESLTGGAAVRLMERVSTGAGGRLELAFDDGTHLTVGEKAEVVLDQFVYDPNGANRFHAAINGAFRYVSGALGAGATRQASITTPFAVIGVRGTDFWGGPTGGMSGVVVFAGVVSVATATGSVVLSAPGEGTDVPVGNVPPGAVSRWPDDKVAAAIATVTFH